MFKSLEDVEIWAERTFSNGLISSKQREYALQIIGHKAQVANLLKSIISNKINLELVASQSYTHPNNFDKIVLLDSKIVGFKLRLHIWWPTTKVLQIEHVHNHAWNFSSKILTGKYRFQIFECGSDGTTMYHYKPGPLANGDTGYKLNFMGMSALRSVFDGVMETGCCYSMSNTLLHRVISYNTILTSTVLIQDDPIQDKWPDVLSDYPIVDAETRPILPFEPNDLITKIQHYLSELKLP